MEDELGAAVRGRPLQTLLMRMGTHRNIVYLLTEGVLREVITYEVNSPKGGLIAESERPGRGREEAVEEREVTEALGEETAEEGELEGMEAMGLILMGMKGMQRDRRALETSS